jgi:trans-2,3-dihydro-3-hydroxyanthranilate isomerase
MGAHVHDAGGMHMQYRYYIVDVFSRAPFGGNQLAVLPEAAGINSKGMQAVAREFNFAETTFVLPAVDKAHTCQVRIFTPKAELPFAGHPTIGTACALVHGAHVGSGDNHDLIFAEGVGPVEVSVKRHGGTLSAKLTLPKKPELPGPAPVADALGDVLRISPSEILEVFFASVGVPLCFVHLRSAAAVDRARLDRASWERTLPPPWSNIFLFAGDQGGKTELYARMFAPALGIEEDPATGAASATLVGVLAGRQDMMNGAFQLSIRQGIAMGRPSEIEAEAIKCLGEVRSVSVAGPTAFVAEGVIEIPREFLA